MLNHKLNARRGFHPRPLWLPRCDKPRTGAPSISLRAGVVWGDRLMSSPSSHLHPEFHINEKGILQSLKNNLMVQLQICREKRGL
jgi:hypothetical protein